MLYETAVTFFWLGILRKRRYEMLCAEFGSLDAVLAELSPSLLSHMGLKGDRLTECWHRYESFTVQRYIEEMKKLDIGLLAIEDDAYPHALKQIADPPVFLSYKGSLDILYGQLIGMVGTRAMTNYGQRAVQLFVPALVQAGITTVSGLALGIDAEVARQTCKTGGKTVAVLGSGLQAISPRTNTQLATEIVEQGGLLLSEYPIEMHPETYTFPARNRIIAGLSRATIVCEAPEKSGAIITADLAFDYGREVFAVPNTIFDQNFTGCNNLIASGKAHLAQSPHEVLRELGMVTTAQHSLFTEPDLESENEKSVYACLSALPQSVDEIAEHATLDTSTIGIALTFMELSGAARNVGQGRWVRS